MSKADPVLEHLKSYRAEDSFFEIDDLPEGTYSEVESSSYTQEGRYQHSTAVLLHKESGRYFGITNSRSGGYHSDWCYNTAEIGEVFKVSVTTTAWKSLPDSSTSS